MSFLKKNKNNVIRSHFRIYCDNNFAELYLAEAKNNQQQQTKNKTKNLPIKYELKKTDLGF